MREIGRFLFKKSTDINEKGLLKLKQGEKESAMHYLLESDNSLISLTLGNSNKIAKVNQNPKVELGFSMKPKDFIRANAEVISDTKHAKVLFNKMLEMKFTHFKKWSDDLVILKFKLQ